MSSSSESPDGAAEPRVIIGVMGQTGVGKSTFINIASGSNLTVGDRLDSCTTAVQGSEQFELDGRLVTLIDTPGFDDSALSDVAVLEMIAAFLGTSYKEKVKLAGVIYIHRISDVRMTGTSKRNFRMFRKLCGENALKNVIIVTTMWGRVGKEEGKTRETELRNKNGFFKDALDLGAKMVRHEHPEDLNSAHEIVRLIIGNNPSPLLIQRELVDQEKPLAETLAGEEVNRELVTLMQGQETEVTKLQQELQEVKDNDAETKRELEQEIEAHKEEIRRARAEIEKLKASKFSWILSGAAAAGVAVAGGLAVVGGAALGGAVALSTAAVTGILALVNKIRS